MLRQDGMVQAVVRPRLARHAPDCFDTQPEHPFAFNTALFYKYQYPCHLHSPFYASNATSFGCCGLMATIQGVKKRGFPSMRNALCAFVRRQCRMSASKRTTTGEMRWIMCSSSGVQ